MKPLELIGSVPAAFSSIAAKVNDCIRTVRALSNIRGINGVKVTTSDTNVVIEYDPDTSEGGTGLPDGYTFEEFTICVDGTPETRYWPTWETNPEP